MSSTEKHCVGWSRKLIRIHTATPTRIAYPITRSTTAPRRILGLSSVAAIAVDVMRGSLPAQAGDVQGRLGDRSVSQQRSPSSLSTARALASLLRDDRLRLEEHFLVILHGELRDVLQVRIAALRVDCELLAENRLVGGDRDATPV